MKQDDREPQLYKLAVIKRWLDFTFMVMKYDKKFVILDMTLQK